MARHIPDDNKGPDKYELEQRRYWKQLHRELEQYKAELGATNLELAQCLGISRQSLVSFMKDPNQGLPIRRSHLERLWDLLTDPKLLEDKSLATVPRSKREELRQEGPDRLLKAAGFLPNLEPILEVRPNRYQQVQRIVSKLSNLPVADFADFIRLIESIETFITRTFPSSNRFGSSEDSSCYSSESTEKLAEDWVERWLEKNVLPHDTGLEVNHKFKAVVSKLSISGKYEVANSEMFDLYMAILENENLDRNVNEFLKMRITQCQFKTLTFMLEDYLNSDSTSIKTPLSKAGHEAEQQLRSASHDTHYSANQTLLDEAVSDVVIEASIVCNFRKTNENICWRYSSSTTHFENMLAAIAYGMGYEPELQLVDFSIRSLGRKDYSLVRTSAAFRELDFREPDHEFNQDTSKTYQGIWVDRSAVLGVLQSVVMAVRGWLGEKFIEDSDCRSYYEVCKAVAEIDNSLVKGRKVLNGYRIQYTGSSDALPANYSANYSANYCLEKEVIDRVEELQKGALKTNPTLHQFYNAGLEHKRCLAKLSWAHSALIEGNMDTAAKLLADIKTYQENSEKYDIPIQSLYVSERLLQQFFSGDRELFINQKQWRYELNEWLQKLSEHIHKRKRYCGRFDIDTYMVAAELFGRNGRLAFCISNPNDAQTSLETTVRSFLKAAYCSSKIGHKQRAAHWINNASRTCCRLGQYDQAEDFANLAENIIRQAVEPTHSSAYREAIMAEVNIARGERLLLTKQNFPKAMEYFLYALKGSIYIGFSRLISDSLYDIARAASYLQNYPVQRSFENTFGKRTEKQEHQAWTLNKDSQGWKANKIAVEAIQFVNDLDKTKEWGLVAPQFQKEAKAIWHKLANFGDAEGQIKHPIEDEIDGYRYLCPVGFVQ